MAGNPQPKIRRDQRKSPERNRGQAGSKPGEGLQIGNQTGSGSTVQIEGENAKGGNGNEMRREEPQVERRLGGIATRIHKHGPVVQPAESRKENREAYSRHEGTMRPKCL